MGVAMETTELPPTTTTSTATTDHPQQQPTPVVRVVAASHTDPHNRNRKSNFVDYVMQLCQNPASDSSGGVCDGTSSTEHHPALRDVSGDVTGDAIKDGYTETDRMVDGTTVHLPQRYKLHKCNTILEKDEDTIKENGVQTQAQTEDVFVEKSSEKDRETDLTQALQWLRHQFAELREQDRQLARQFISLRSSIHHMQVSAGPPLLNTLPLPRNTSFSSAEDLGCYGSSTLSLDDGVSELGSRPSNSALRVDDYSGDFRPRTQSLLEPRAASDAGSRSYSPMLTVRKFGRTLSKECF